MAHGDITHIDIPVSNSTVAAGFYRALFGWRIEEIPGFEGYPMWQGPNQVSGGGLAPRSEGFTAPRSYVEVESIEEALATVREQGGSVLMERTPITETSWFAVLADPDGNELGLFEGITGD